MPRRRTPKRASGPLHVDGLRHQLTRLLGEVAPGRTRDAIWHETIRRVAAAAEARLSLPDEPVTLEGLPAYEALVVHHEEAVRWATRLAHRYSAPEWLFYLRRAGGVFNANHHPSTPGYCQVLAEAISLRSKARPPDVRLSDPMHAYPVDADVALHIARFAEAVVLIYTLHGRLRWAGKGAPVEFRPGAVPRERPDTELASAVRLYDRRLNRNMLAPLGVLESRGKDLHVEPGTPFVPIWSGLRELVPLPLLDGSGESVEAAFTFDRLFLSDAPHLAMGSSRLDESDVALIVVLVGVLMEEFLESGPILGQAFRTGYIHLKPASLQGWLWYGLGFVRSGVFGPLIDASTIPVDPDRTIEVLETLRPEVFPPKHGSPLRRTALGYIVDLEGATWSFLTRLRRLSVIGGPVANARAATFEEQVQDMIDQTPARPRDAWRAYRGRTLRLEGDAVTDIDAILEQDGAVVLVNCKSVPDSDDLERSDYRTIRNSVSRVHADLASWQGKVDRIRNHPVGDNYDFSSAARIEQIVVYPKALYVPMGDAIREVLPGLPAAVAADELRRWSTDGYDILRSAEGVDLLDEPE